MAWILIIVLTSGHSDRFYFPTQDTCQNEEAMQHLHSEVRAAVCVPNIKENR